MKTLLTFFVLFFTSSVVAEGCISGDCTNGYGTYIYFNGNEYVGEFKNDEMNGQGTLTYGPGKWEGYKYIGEFKNNQINGQGTLTFAKGSKYVGEFKNGNAHGQGTYTHPNGDEYVGENKNGNAHGQGIYTYADGSVEKGIWKNGELVEMTSSIWQILIVLFILGISIILALLLIKKVGYSELSGNQKYAGFWHRRKRKKRKLAC